MSATSAAIPIRAARRRLRPRLAALVAAGSLVVALVGAYVGTNVWASIQQNSLESRFDHAAAAWEALDPVERSAVDVAQGDPVARLEIPSIGLGAVVIEGATPALMRRGPAHLPGSATPGDQGVAIVTANRFAFGSFFLRLDRLEIGDRIVTQSPVGRTTYTVVEMRVVPADRLDLATDSTERVLMLFASARLWGGGDRIVVRAVAGKVV